MRILAKMNAWCILKLQDFPDHYTVQLVNLPAIYTFENVNVIPNSRLD